MVSSPVAGSTVPASLVCSQPSDQRVGSDNPTYGEAGIPTSSSPFSSRTVMPGAGSTAGRLAPNRSVAMTPTSVMPYMLPSRMP